MGSAKPRRRLIVNADDFGHSTAVNEAVLRAHREGILTTASLMVTGDAVENAVQIARENPSLGVGLHLVLCCGTAASPPYRVPTLVDQRGHFSNDPVKTGLKYFFSRTARTELETEITAQLDRFQSTGLPLDHLNGHLHFHLHPSVLAILIPQFAPRRLRAIRITRDPLRIDWALGRGRWTYRLSHALVFSCLSSRASIVLRKAKVAQTNAVFGLLENGRVTEDYIIKLARVLPPGDSELYTHPSITEAQHELAALISPRVKRALAAENIELIRYQDL